MKFCKDFHTCVAFFHRCVIMLVQVISLGVYKVKTPKLQIRLNDKQAAARDFLQECGYDINFIIRQFLIQLYEKELTKRGLV